MRRSYFLIMLVCLLFANNGLLSQCRHGIVKIDSVCSNVLYTYTPSDLTTTPYLFLSYTWTRPFVTGIKNQAQTKAGTITLPNQPRVIAEMLNNTTLQPVEVKYIVTLTPTIQVFLFNIPICTITDTIKVIVNPVPVIESIGNKSYCNGDAVSGILFRSNSPKPSFTWKCDRDIGFDTSIHDSIRAFTAKNTGTTAVIAHVTVSVLDSTLGCLNGTDSTFTITVNPSPPKPGFTSLSQYSDSNSLILCSGSENINFNVNSPNPGIAYHWTSSANSSMVAIRDTSHANTVISFYGAGNNTINLIAEDSNGCTKTASQVVQVTSTPSGTDKRKIFLSQPGNLLIYPNNFLTAYQWGYDTVIHTTSDSSFGPSVPVEGQVYQFFIPGSKFIDASNNLLNETNYLYWVMLRNGSCTTRVYYNGPYANRVIGTLPADSTVQLQIVPNPNKGVFEIALKGNIYGNIHAQIYNSTGQVVFSKNFKKITPDIIEQMNTNNLPGGLYFLVLNSSDLKKISSRLVIQH